MTSHPLSSAQLRLWFLDQLEPGSSAYNLAAVIRLSGRLDTAALEQAVGQIARRHAALRATFTTAAGQPVQVIAPPAAITLPVTAVSEAQVQPVAAAEARRPFDLARGPAWRASLLQLSAREHVLLLTAHYIVCDERSLEIFFNELAALYAACIAGTPVTLPDLPISYPDFAARQREWLRGPGQAHLAYWQDKLAGPLPALQLPLDQPRPPAHALQGTTQTLSLSGQLSHALKELSRRQGVSLFVTLLAAFKTLLYRYTGQEDIIVGAPIPGRLWPETDGVIGLFTNTLALRTDLSGQPSFLDVVERVQAVVTEAQAHQEVPFEELVQTLQLERTLSRHPVFDVTFELDTLHTTLELPGLACRGLERTGPQPRVALALSVKEQGDALELRLAYPQTLFSAARIACLLQQLRFLLEQAAAAPDRSIRSYSLVTPESRARLPDPGAALAEPRLDPVTTLVAAWAERRPEQPAIRQGERTWSYGELAARAQALAQALLARQVEPGEPVAVFGPRSPGLIASLLGVLSSGGAILPLDPNLPGRRLQLMLQEARVKRLLYVSRQQPREEWIDPAVAILRVDPGTGQTDASAHPAARPLPNLAPDGAAYIFFTSGTTGIPKGVLGCHKGLAHFLRWQQQTFEIGPQDKSAQLTGLSFDVVLRDIFLPLTSGATLCLPPEQDDLGPDRILPWLDDERISILHTVPSLAQVWLANVPPGVSLRTLRWVFFAGEPLTEALVHRWREAFPHAGEIINLYGPTETSLAKCWYRVPATTSPGVQPIGSPLPETQALILAENNALCGIGEPGEIVLRTPFRSLGYINAPEENARRFVQNPFRDDPGDLLYYTGDRGRYRPDGSLDILGRLDHQVKIRGIRVEPAEIEAVLGQHPAIWENVVIASGQPDAPGRGPRLVAYVVPSPGHAPTPGELRRFLQDQLPDYMVPSTFVMLDALPLTPNGKVDRRALPEPGAPGRDAERAFVAPRSPDEQLLAGLWAEALGIEPVGIHDDFFELGGHSLLATQLVSRLRRALQMELSVRSLFQFPTIAGLAQYIQTIRWAAQAMHAPPRRDDSGEREEGEV